LFFCIKIKNSHTTLLDLLFYNSTNIKADALAERLRRKAELQKKGARPASFKESLSQEMGKQKGMEKTKMERRNAMCEELGRGC
jgi:hypothetical protein